MSKIEYKLCKIKEELPEIGISNDLIIYLEKWALIVIFALGLPRRMVGDKYSPLFY